MNIKINQAGLDRLQRKLQEMKKKYPAATKQGMIDTGFAIQKVAKELVRVDTGRLRASISVVWKGGNSQVDPGFADIKAITPPTDEYTVLVGTIVKYAAPQEFGTKFMKGKPYLRPAFIQEVKNLLNNIKRRL
ncbi:MAG: HK97 gp10 family phage protein [Ignavibacteriales bacterium]|nr:HK97 gp10 family phage protein [Ignavibacteriales bacterium]